MDPKPDSTQDDNNSAQVPLQTAPQAPAPKKGLSTGARIAIIAGSVFVVLVIVGMIFAVLAFARTVADIAEDGPMTGSSSANSNANPEFDALAEYNSTEFTFSYPSAWQQKDTSNQTTIIGGEEPDAYVVILAEPKDSPAIVNYTYTKGSAAPVDKERARSAMKTALQTQKAATESQLLSMRESSGHGCAANITYTDQPTYVEEGDLIGYAYGYTCDSLYGPVQGVYGVWYDEFGAQHRLLVSALKQYWDDNESGLEAIVKSAKAL